MSIFFYLFACLILLSALAVVISKNPVYAVLCLIFCFFNAAALFVLLGAEYIAMTLIIVYVGAVAVLFLFVVMMLNVNTESIRKSIVKYLPFGLAMIFTLIGIIFFAYQQSANFIANINLKTPPAINNTKDIGLHLYTDYILAFQMSGIILFVAMLGAIVLTVRHTKYIRRQNIKAQVMKQRSECVELKQVEFGKGVEL
jgi:NADH-quinone oxidoreductase subunit J